MHIPEAYQWEIDVAILEIWIVLSLDEETIQGEETNQGEETIQGGNYMRK